MFKQLRLTTIMIVFVGAVLMSCTISQILRPTWSLRTATGTVVRAELVRDPATNQANFWVDVRFQPKPGEYVVLTRSPQVPYSVGDTVPVHYQPWDPANLADIGPIPNGMVVLNTFQVALIGGFGFFAILTLWVGLRRLYADLAKPLPFRYRW